MSSVLHRGLNLSLKTACEIATRLTESLVQPIAAQIDPYRLSEVDRLMRIARAYGERIKSPNLKEGALARLIEDYPAHDFVIDSEEVKTLFNKVADLDNSEYSIILGLGNRALTPQDEPDIMDLTSLADFEPDKEQSDDGGDADADDREGDNGAEASAPRPLRRAPAPQAPAKRRRQGPAAKEGGADRPQRDPGGARTRAKRG